MKLSRTVAVLCLLHASAALAQKVIAPTPLPAPAQTVAQPASSQAAHDWAARNLPKWPVERQVLAAHLVTRYGEPRR